MSRDDVVRVTQELARANRPFVLATVDQAGQPRVRWMGGCVLDEPITLLMAVGAKSRKMDQIRANPAAQVMFHDEQFSRVATITGGCEIVEGIESRRRLWESMPVLSRYMSGPEDPEFGVIRFVGRRIELIGMAEGMTPQVAEL